MFTVVLVSTSGIATVLFSVIIYFRIENIRCILGDLGFCAELET